MKFIGVRMLNKNLAPIRYRTYDLLIVSTRSFANTMFKCIADRAGLAELLFNFKVSNCYF